jgi:GT2 family glycosyltransferase
MPSPLVCIILLNYNGAKDTLECLKSIQKITYPNYKVIIVDNYSEDLSEEIIIKWLKNNKENYDYLNLTKGDNLVSKSLYKYTFIQSGENRGFGAGNNIGIKYAINNYTDYVLILNNDTIVDPQFIEPMVKMSDIDKSIGIVSGKIYYYDKPNVLWFNGGKFNNITGKISHYDYNKLDNEIEHKDISFISGCMWLIPKSIFDIVGLIDEDFFMYYEDVAYCHRLKRHNYKLAIAPESKIFHKVNLENELEFNKFNVYWRTRSSILFLKKIRPNILFATFFIYNNIIKIMIRLFSSGKFFLIKQQFNAICNSYRKII